MPQVNPDYSDSEFKEGVYVAEIVGSEVKTGKQSGAPYVNWRLKVGPGVVFYSTPLVGRGAGMFKHMVHTAGDTAYVSGAYSTESLHGKKIKVYLEKSFMPDGSPSSYPKVKEIQVLEESLAAPNLNEADTPF